MRLCRCESCGSAGAMLPPHVYTAHQKRQRRRSYRAAHEDVLASLLSGSQYSQHAMQGPTNYAGGDSTQTPPSALTAGADIGTNPSCRQTLQAEAFESCTLDFHSATGPPSPLLPPSHDADDDGPDLLWDNFFGEEDDHGTLPPGSDDEDDPPARDGDAIIDPDDEQDRYGEASIYERGIGSDLIDRLRHPSPLGARLESLPRWQVLFYVFILWLGTQHQLSDNVLSMLVKFVLVVMLPAPSISPGAPQAVFPALHTSPRAIRRALGLEPPFVRYVVCPACSELYPWVVKDSISRCRVCRGRLLQEALVLGNGKVSRRPQLFYTVSPVRTWLETLLQQKDIEAAIDQAFVETNRRDKSRPMEDIMDGSAWVKASDPQGTPYTTRPLCLQLTLNIDWFSPFRVGASSWHSSGTVALMLNNLPDHLRHQHLHLAAVLPGPTETKADSICKLLAPIIQELKLLQQGVMMKTARDGRERLVQARLLMFCGDAPARAKTCGFLSHRAQEYCGNCKARKEDRHLPVASSEPRTAEEHKRAALAAFADKTDGQLGAATQDRLARERGGRWSELYQLSYWSSVLQTPPDPMHCVYLGIVKRFWHKLFVEAICGGSHPLLVRAQGCLAGYKEPLNMKRPDKRLGDKGGSNPNADQWCCLSRNILPFQFATLFDDELCSEAREDDEGAYVHVRYPPKSRSLQATERRPLLEKLMQGGSLSEATAALKADEHHRDLLARVVVIVENAGSTIPTISTTQERAAPASTSTQPTQPTQPSQPEASRASISLPELVASTGDPDPANCEKEPTIGATRPTSAAPTAGSSIDALVPKRDLFLLAMHVAAIAELTYAPAITEEDIKALERATEGHLLLSRQISKLWPTVNTHFVQHLPEFIRRFGPCQGWWAFSFERINGWLSQAAGRKSNRKRDGQVEYAMMRAWWQRGSIKEIVDAKGTGSGARIPGEEDFWAMVTRKGTRRSTIDAQADARIYPSHADYGRVLFGQKTAERELLFDATQDLVDFLNNDTGVARYATPWSYCVDSRNLVEIRRKASLHQSMTYKGLRYVAMEGRANRHEGSTFAVASRQGEPTACQILRIFEHQHSTVTGDTVTGRFVQVRWLEPVPWPSEHPMAQHRWLADIIRCHLAEDTGQQKTSVIRANQIVCQAAVTPCTVDGRALLGVKHLYS